MSDGLPYRSAALNGAFLRGADAARAGRTIDTNPYRRASVRRDPRRGSWSEAWSRAWALGFQSVRR